MQPTRTPRVLIIVIAALMAALLASCSMGGSTGGYGEVDSGSYPEATQAGGGGGDYPQDPAAPPAPGDVERMIIRTMTVRLEVDNTRETMDAVRTLADAHEAIVANMRMASEDDWVYDSPVSSEPLRGWLTVRVPVDGVEAFVAELSELGEVVYQAETSDDVTQEHVDLSARLENLRAQEQRLRELVAQAATVEETLLVEQELWRIRGEIESLDAQIQYLERQAAMATVTVELTQDAPVTRDWGFLEAFRDGIRAAGAVAAFVVTFLIATSPLWIAGLAAFFIVRSIRRRRRAAKSEVITETAEQPKPTVTDETPATAPSGATAVEESGRE